jgi:hypothetical protein
LDDPSQPKCGDKVLKVETKRLTDGRTDGNKTVKSNNQQAIIVCENNKYFCCCQESTHNKVVGKLS